jgi:DNA-binding CsgD family transcriptional regulator
VDTPHTSPHPSSAGKQAWPGCAGWWIRSRRRARSWSSPARRAVALTGRQAQALQGALGVAKDPVAADPLLTGVAVLTLLSDLSERSPVLVAADNAHWLDRSSLDVLAFAASRLDAERVVVLVGARGQAPPPGLDRGFPELHLGPLSAADAGRLLDAQPVPPRGPARAHVLAQAEGNPMALIELAKVIAEDPAASRRWAAEPLPLTDRLSAVISSRFAALPARTQAALLLAAVADGPELTAAASHGGGPDALTLAPAEREGLVTVDRAGLRFAHPLVRSAIFSYLGVADIAAAAVHADRRMEGQDVLERALSHLDGPASPRLDQLIARARGILAGPDGAEAHFDKALSDPAGDQWPFERAQLRLDYAEWLRRRRRINDTKPVLTQALGTFRRLRARSWAQRAEAELRACGVAVADAPGEPDALSKLTPQQRQIVRLASDGLTNREIGDRLFLSPRTVSSHLYRSFPKLGVADRHQLRDVIAHASTPAPPHENAENDTSL